MKDFITKVSYFEKQLPDIKESLEIFELFKNADKVNSKTRKFSFDLALCLKF